MSHLGVTFHFVYTAVQNFDRLAGNHWWNRGSGPSQGIPQDCPVCLFGALACPGASSGWGPDWPAPRTRCHTVCDNSILTNIHI